MKNSAYDTLFRVEDTLWWFVSRRGLYAGLLDGCKNLKILDAGCGTGSDMVFLREYGDVVGVDISKKALGYNRKRGNKVVQGDINNLPFKDDTFDLVLAGDCIYHQWVDDKKAIRGFYRVLKKGGCLIVNTAAYESLRSKHDEAVMTKKRYTKKSLRNLLIENDFKIQKIFYWNSILLPARILSLIFSIGDSENSDLQQGSFLNRILLFIMKIETGLLRMGVAFPFGNSIMCKARKE